MPTQTKPKGTRPQLSDAEREKRRKERADKFVELAQKRVRRIVGYLDQLRPLASYPHTDEQVDAIETALMTAVTSAMTALRPRGTSNGDGFTL